MTTISTSEYMKQYYQDNKEKIKEQKKQYYQKNKENIIKNQIQHYQKNKEQKRIYDIRYRKDKKKKIDKDKIQYYQKNKVEILIYKIQHYQKNKKQKRVYNILYYQKNKKVLNEKNREYINERRRNDKNFRVLTTLRSRLHKAFKSYSRNEKITTADEYGINYNNIIKHLKPFPVNIKAYHIDHIIPLASFDFSIDSEIKKAFAPKNHQWLLAEENLKKGKRIQVQSVLNF